MEYHQITALVADDESHLRMFVRLLLNKIGITDIHEARSGLEAIEGFAKHQPDLIVMDINMPSMTGLEALAEIQSLGGDPVTIMMTAVSTRDAVEESKHKGASYYILKTQTPDAIEAAIRKVIDAKIVPQSQPQP